MISCGVVITVYLARKHEPQRQQPRHRMTTHNLMICGCLNNCKYAISLSTRPAISRLVRFFLEIILSATFCPVTSWIASLTLPNDPSPTVLMIRYCPRRLSGLWSIRVGCLLAEGRCGDRVECCGDGEEDGEDACWDAGRGRKGGMARSSSL